MAVDMHYQEVPLQKNRLQTEILWWYIELTVKELGLNKNIELWKIPFPILPSQSWLEGLGKE